MKTKWIRFFDHNGKELVSISADGLFAGEIAATIDLLAYENQIPASTISFAEVEG